MPESRVDRIVWRLLDNAMAETSLATPRLNCLTEPIPQPHLVTFYYIKIR